MDWYRLRKLLPSVQIALCLLGVGSCRTAVSTSAAPVQFDTATAWIHQDSDSTALLVEIARSEAQHELGLSGRPFLDAESGMLFQFDRVRSGDEGFWMVGVEVPSRHRLPGLGWPHPADSDYGFVSERAVRKLLSWILPWRRIFFCDGSQPRMV